MARPQTREEFKQFCLRQLGAPVIDINVDDEQVEDRIDEALQYFRDYHYDGTERVFYKHVLTAADKTNGYITLPEDIVGVIRIFDIGSSYQTTNLFSIRYQLHLNELFDFSSVSYVNYVMAMTHIENLEQIFVGKQPIRFHKHTNKLYIDVDYDFIETGDYIIVDGYRTIDPVVYTDIWNDRWLQRYTTCLIKIQWGNNLKKFEGVQLPGGVTMNGQRIFDEGIEERRQLEEQMINSYSIPPEDMIG